MGLGRHQNPRAEAEQHRHGHRAASWASDTSSVPVKEQKQSDRGAGGTALPDRRPVPSSLISVRKAAAAGAQGMPGQLSRE